MLAGGYGYPASQKLFYLLVLPLSGFLCRNYLQLQKPDARRRSLSPSSLATRAWTCDISLAHQTLLLNLKAQALVKKDWETHRVFTAVRSLPLPAVLARCGCPADGHPNPASRAETMAVFFAVWLPLVPTTS